ncbi:hypothetical protein Pst134EA_021084 [Puccinia striiformis f. sp. tritici]|nr:hypothetical protein Pst134EA_021084 [Puccinia striiformis f. sp. tritici]KAH9457200.1 hypothetical protein Pst134EA_021084 [Puccinia striiformis f. sp. tritici]
MQNYRRTPSPYPRSYDATQAIPSGMRSLVYSPRSQWLRGHETIHLRRGALPRRSYVRFEQTEFNPPMADPNTAQFPNSGVGSSYHEATRFPPGLTPILNAATPNLLSPIHSPTYENPGPINFEQNNNAQASSTSYPVYRPPALRAGSPVLMANRAALHYPEHPPPAPNGGPDLPSPDNLVWPIDVDGPPEYDHGIEDGGNEASSTTGENPARNEPADPNEDPIVIDSDSAPHSMAGSRVPTPNPPNFFDPDDYHRLRPTQIRAFITRPNDPLRYDRYLFGPQEFHDMYQSMVSVFRRYCLACPDGNFVDERVHAYQEFTRCYRAAIRRVRRV